MRIIQTVDSDTSNPKQKKTMEEVTATNDHGEEETFSAYLSDGTETWEVDDAASTISEAVEAATYEAENDLEPNEGEWTNHYSITVKNSTGEVVHWESRDIAPLEYDDTPDDDDFETVTSYQGWDCTVYTSVALGSDGQIWWRVERSALPNTERKDGQGTCLLTDYDRRSCGWGETPEAPSYGDAMKKLADKLTPDMIEGIVERDDSDELEALADAIRGKVTVEVTNTDDDWRTDDDGDPTCCITWTLEMTRDGESLLTGEVKDYYSQCVRCGEQFSAWQSFDGPAFDSATELMKEIIGEDAITEMLDAPDEPEEPEEDEDGHSVVLFHGWEQDWEIVGRYDGRDDASAAMRIHQRGVREANTGGAYGWDHAIGFVVEEGTEGAELIGDLWILIDSDED